MVGPVGEFLHAVRIAHVAHDGNRRTSRGAELFAHFRDGGCVDIGKHDRHPQRGGVAGQSRADSRACPGDDRDAVGKRIHAYCTAGRGRASRNGRSGCRVGATRCGPSSTLRQMAIAVMRTGAARR